MVFRSYRHRLLAVCCALLAVSGFATPAHADDPPTTSHPKAAAGWLARQLVDGERIETIRDGVPRPDPELTLDAVFAFAAAKVADDAAARALAWVSRPDVRDGYLGDGNVEAYVGPTARLALAVQIRGGDPTSVNGVNLISRLHSLRTSSGRFVDRSVHGDRSTTASQAFAILALQRTAAKAPAAAVSFLIGSQCADGGYPVVPGQPVCQSDVDSTVLAGHALLAAGRWDEASDTVGVLIRAQGSDGGLRDSAGVVNTVTTGLATAVFNYLGWTINAIIAQSYLTRAQLHCGAPEPLWGAIGYDEDTFDPMLAPRSTALGLLGMTTTLYGRLSLYNVSPAAPVLDCG